MYILAIETTGAYASVALAKAADAKAGQPEAGKPAAEVLATVHGHDRFSHLQNLTPQIQEVLDECQLSMGDVDAIAVSRGPGSFTGIRIGVSTARALAQVTGKACIGVSSLQALAMRAAAVAGKADRAAVVSQQSDSRSADPTEPVSKGTLICPILDARRSQVYGGGYFVKDGQAEEAIKAGPYTVEEFLELAAGYEKLLFVGDGVDAYQEKIEAARPEGTAFASVYQDAEQVAQLAAKLAAEGRTCTFEELKPDYMRLAEAERKLREKQNG